MSWWLGQVMGLGRRRARWGVIGVVAAVGLGGGGLTACDVAPMLVLSVTSTADVADHDPGDGVCEATAGAGDCTLRAAIDEADATSPSAFSSVRVQLGSANYVLTAPGMDDTNVGGDLDLHAAVGVTVVGDGGSSVSAGVSDGVFDVISGSFTLARVGVDEGRGPGVSVRAGASAAVGFSSFTTTEPVFGQPVALLVAPGADAVLTNSTVTVPSNRPNNVGIDNRGTLHGSFDTVTSVATAAGSVTTFETSAVNNCFSSGSSVVQSLGHDATSAQTECFPGASDTVVVDSFEAVDLAVTGTGSEAVHLLTAGSPLIDAVPVGQDGCMAGQVDQRFGARPVGTGCDIGASEAVPVGFTVDTAADLPDASPGDGSCVTASSSCSLRAAIDEANASFGDVAITIAAGVDPVLTRVGAGEDANATGDLDVHRPVRIDGNGATIDGGGLDRVIDHFAGQLTLDDLTVTHGLVDDQSGGGGVRSAAPLTARDVVVRDSRAGSGGGLSIVLGAEQTIERDTLDHVDVVGNQASQAGGVLIDDEFTLGALNWVTWNGGSVSDNTATADAGVGTAGGIVAMVPPNEGARVLTADELVIDGNRSASIGAVAGYTGGVGLTRSTIAHNHGPIGILSSFDAGVDVIQSTVMDNDGPVVGQTSTNISVGFRGSTVAGNVGASSINFGSISASGSILTSPAGSSICAGSTFPGGPNLRGDLNVIDDPSCIGSDPNDVDPQLGPLGDHGGATPTAVPDATSPAVDAIPTGTANLCDPTTPTDQRGVTRPQGPACDIGAVERP